MKNHSIKSLYSTVVVVLILIIASCKKEETTVSGIGSLDVEFDNRANGNTLTLGANYLNANNDTMNFSIFNYYVSNFSLTKSDGSVYTVPKDSCYFLIKQSDPAALRTITLKNIPAGDYKSISFTVGVDSLKNTAPISERKGVLDPATGGEGMYWAWNSGYIFVKAEGTSPQAPIDATSNTRKFRYHIGLFGGMSSKTVNNVKKITLSDADGEVAKVRTNLTPNFHIKVDVMEMFKTPNVISVKANPTVMVTPFSVNIANNYVDMFKTEHIHN